MTGVQTCALPISIALLTTEEWFAIVIPGVTIMLTSYSSELLITFKALIYPTEPADAAVEQFIPNTLVEVILDPTLLVIAGSIPSNPPWKGTLNFKKVVTSNPAKVDPEILRPVTIDEFELATEALGCTKHSSKLKALPLVVTPLANGFK